MRRVALLGMVVAVAAAAIAVAVLSSRPSTAAAARPAPNRTVRPVQVPPASVPRIRSTGSSCYVSIPTCSPRPCVELIGSASPSVAVPAVQAIATPRPTSRCGARRAPPQATTVVRQPQPQPVSAQPASPLQDVSAALPRLQRTLSARLAHK